jgi:hypothetical protein
MYAHSTQNFFENLFGPVFMVTVCVNNGYLMQLFKKKKFLQKELRFEELEEHRYDTNDDESKSIFKRCMEVLGIVHILCVYILCAHFFFYFFF